MKKYIITILLNGLGCAAFAQQTDKPFNNQFADSLNIGYEISVPQKTSAFSVSGVGKEVFENAPQTDIAKALYGKIAGLNVSQGSGTSADNFSGLSLHGHAPLVLVDGFPRDIKDLLTTEIESVAVLKDALAATLYGVRGANGVILVTTKQGKESKLNVKVGYQFGINHAFRKPRFADAYTYAQNVNTALKNDGLEERYNQYALDAFKNGSYPNEFPNVDWWNEAMNNTGSNHRLDLTFTGGNQRVKYFTTVEYFRDQAMYNHSNEDNRYNVNPTDTRLNLRTNILAEITNTTHMKLGLYGKLQEVNQAAACGGVISAIYGTPSAAFPVKHEGGIYGGTDIWKNNPVGMLFDSGNSASTYGTLLADLNLTQDLDMLTPGLKASIAISFDNSGAMYDGTSKEYRYMDLRPQFTNEGVLTTAPVIYGKDSETLSHPSGFSSLYMRTDLQAKIGYERLFAGAHRVSGALLYDQQAFTRNGRNNSHKRQSIMATATYNYKDRYIVNGAFSYSGSAVLPPNDQYRSYPAVSATWVASNESFLKEIDFLNLLKVRASYGLSGWDGSIGHELFRQSYGGGGSYAFGDGVGGQGGSAEGTLPVENLTVEKSEKATLGIDLAVFNNRLNFSGDLFYEKRSDILVSASNSISSIIGIGMNQINAGIYKYKGADLSLGWQDQIGDFGYGIIANVSCLNSEVINENQAFEEFDYLYHMGDRIGQSYGLEALGFFKDQTEINNSPHQTFSEVRPGDIKYKDQNGDNKIDDKDVVRMYDTGSPRFYFGLNIKLSYKNFEISADLQGRRGVTVNLLNSPLYRPLVNNGNISQTFLDREIPWTANSENATMPRLTTQANANNYRSSSMWYRDGSFLKLRNLMISYTIPKSKIRLADLKVFVQGSDLFSIDKIDFADPEMLGAGYPSVTAYWTGVKFNF
ncbi:SusC/RagA family TonB-linked outer membrane protein [Parabacteroides faecis]|uniref:SusC/RagA family TonB-linked outer membrane protein n=1 Tax=Parabacteroides TaxID=375288 RepID=UPI000EFDDAB3|nr:MULTISPECIES: SusC/RagA family TonB-linked outer membrane protein [Parabacteroides]MBC8620031.1 SusC/RagA family TonB-linked outer membrane protein [Parabacteroides faecis]RHR96397.1 SusC/RagA family TonB-linked outer membrane protein [Parabacteroides sp. AF14-59]